MTKVFEVIFFFGVHSFNNKMSRSTKQRSSSKTKLMAKFRPHQRRVASRISGSNSPHGLVVAHDPGTGKTKAGVLALRMLLFSKKVKFVWVVVPKSVIGAWNAELKLQMTSKLARHTNTRVVTHHWLSKNYHRVLPTDGIILDEAHNIRNQTAFSHKIHVACSVASKVLLLTGTPVVNSVQDLAALISICNQKDMKTVSDELQKYVKLGEWASLIRYLQPFVDVHQSSGSTDYANVHEVADTISMDAAYKNMYNKIEAGNLTPMNRWALYGSKTAAGGGKRAFQLYVRRACNEIAGHSPKADVVVNYIQKQTAKGHKIVLYSQFVEFGIELIDSRLQRMNIPCRIISGSESVLQRQKYVSEYNDESNEIRVMLITVAGSEGINLLRTHAVIFMEPFWHRARLIQVIARGRRFQGHQEFHPSKRLLQVHHMIMTRDDPKLPTADENLHLIISRKHGIMLMFRILMLAASEKRVMTPEELKEIKNLQVLKNNAVLPQTQKLVNNYTQDWDWYDFGTKQDKSNPFAVIPKKTKPKMHTQ